MFQSLLKSRLPLSKHNVLKIKVFFGTLNGNVRSQIHNLGLDCSKSDKVTPSKLK